MTQEQAYPLGWQENLERTLDLDAAFAALEGYEHFHSYTLRGALRHHQARLDEALVFYENAESRFASFDATPENRRLHYLLMGSMLSARVFQEALSGSREASARTDDELDRFLSIENPDTIQRDKNVALYDLSRGNYHAALDRLETVIEATRRTPERCIAAYICAAAAAHELGLYKESRRHYENAELTMCCNCNRFVFALYLTWLLALCQHWGWESERQRWDETINALDCPEATRDCLLDRAQLMHHVCRSAKSLVFA